MKIISLIILSLLFFATAFQGDSPPPGWYIQQIPVNKNIVDIHFTDTLHGWAVTGNLGALDSGYILKTTNGGTNWLLNYATNRNFFAIQFVDTITGYACGGWGTGKFYKTTNSGNNWNLILSGGIYFTDLYFSNKDTGWVCDGDNAGIGLLKTTNGGLNWTQQLSQAYSPKKLFFLNKDTGWVMTVSGGIYRTNNSGVIWMPMHNFGVLNMNSIFFTSSDTGWVIESQFVYKTVNGGYNWIIQQDPYSQGSGPQNIYMINSTYGYITTAFFKILKTIDGINWGQLNAPTGNYNSIFFTDSLKGWVHHGNIGNNDIASTMDGGGPITYIGIEQNGNFIPSFELGQNYPNPFNASTRIKFSILKSCYLDLKIFNIKGQEVASLITGLGYKPGDYDFYFDAGKYSLSSGVYFYYMKGATTDNKEIFIDTKRMLMIK